MLAIAVIKNSKLDRLLFGLFVCLFGFAMGCKDEERKLTGKVGGAKKPPLSGSGGGKSKSTSSSTLAGNGSSSAGSGDANAVSAEGARNCGTATRAFSAREEYIKGHLADCINRGRSCSKGCLCELHAAIEQQDVDMVEALIRGGVDVNRRYRMKFGEFLGEVVELEGCPPLYAAVDNYLANSDASIKIVQMLIDKGADINTSYTTTRCADKSVLYLAVEKNILPIVQTLIDKGADVNTKFVEKPVLYLAVEENSLPIVQTLIAKGADVNGCYQGKSVLYLAVEKNSLPIVQLLIAKGADVNTSYADKPVLYLAVERACLPIIKEFVKLKGVNLHLRYRTKSILEKAKETDMTIYNLLFNYFIDHFKGGRG